MATLSKLNFHPVKSCGTIALTEATLTPAGLMHDCIYDREWIKMEKIRMCDWGRKSRLRWRFDFL